MSIFGIPQSFIAYNLKYSAVWSYPFKAAAYYEYWHLLSYRQAFSFVLPIVLVFAIKHKKKMDTQPQRKLHFHENSKGEYSVQVLRPWSRLSFFKIWPFSAEFHLTQIYSI